MDSNQLAGHMLRIGLAIWLDQLKMEKLHILGVPNTNLDLLITFVLSF